jgi:GNAT superfamily N-acetyltransferase
VSLTFRVAAPPDLDLVVALMREYYDFDRLAFDAGRARAALTTLLGDASLGRVWILADGGEAIGYAALTLGYSLEFHGRDAFVDELYIRPSHRGRGYGARALTVLEAACRELGVGALHLEVGRENARARSVYHAAGFEDRDRHLMTKRVSR